jgi:hypothetical protein
MIAFQIVLWNNNLDSWLILSSKPEYYTLETRTI